MGGFSERWKQVTERGSSKEPTSGAAECRAAETIPRCWSRSAQEMHFKSKGSKVPPNNALERTVRHRGPRLAAAQPSCPAAQRDR